MTLLHKVFMDYSTFADHQHVVNKHQANAGRPHASYADKLSIKLDVRNSHISRKWG